VWEDKKYLNQEFDINENKMVKMTKEYKRKYRGWVHYCQRSWKIESNKLQINQKYAFQIVQNNYII